MAPQANSHILAGIEKKAVRIEDVPIPLADSEKQYMIETANIITKAVRSTFSKLVWNSRMLSAAATNKSNG